MVIVERSSGSKRQGLDPDKRWCGWEYSGDVHKCPIVNETRKMETGHLVQKLNLENDNGIIALCGQKLPVIGTMIRATLIPGVRVCSHCKAIRDSLKLKAPPRKSRRQLTEEKKLVRWNKMASGS